MRTTWGNLDYSVSHSFDSILIYFSIVSTVSLLPLDHLYLWCYFVSVVTFEVKESFFIMVEVNVLAYFIHFNSIDSL